ncbi:hypothetical protein AB0G74_20900 [Streptomyces sp. NPDC020875]|uniref:hypothetical protein n=1 Tax=Streptomyces sp. NPDC020875 TaxID=3154898 RepID=UPI0033D21EEF
MIQSPPASVFASVRQHFADPQVKDNALVHLAPGTPETEPVRMTPTEVYAALNGPDADPWTSGPLWDAVLDTARADRTLEGTGRLLLIWLLLPRLTGTAHRVCLRLRADRSDVEAEMTLALLEELAATDNPNHSCISPLIRTARTRAWTFARAGLREKPSTLVERITQDRAVVPPSEPADTAPDPQILEVQVDRPDGPEGLRASLRFRVRPEHLREGVLTGGGSGTNTTTATDGRDGATSCRPHRRRRSRRRRVGTLPIRPSARRP